MYANISSDDKDKPSSGLAAVATETKVKDVSTIFLMKGSSECNLNSGTAQGPSSGTAAEWSIDKVAGTSGATTTWNLDSGDSNNNKPCKVDSNDSDKIKCASGNTAAALKMKDTQSTPVVVTAISKTGTNLQITPNGGRGTSQNVFDPSS